MVIKLVQWVKCVTVVGVMSFHSVDEIVRRLKKIERALKIS